MARAVAIAAVAWLALAAAPPGPGATDAQAAAPLIRTSVDRIRPYRRLPRSFIGFSIEYERLQSNIGAGPTGVNPVLVDLLRNIAREGNGRPLLRIGGASGDESWWNPTLQRPRPPGIDFDIRPGWVASLQAFRARFPSPLILGLNLASGDPSITTEWARVAHAAFPGAIRAFELGNEPDRYSQRGYGQDANGRQVTARPRGWGLREYVSDWARRADGVRAVAPGVPLAGPSACCDPRWWTNLPGLLRAERRRLSLVSYHYYTRDVCGLAPGARNYPTIRGLLDPASLDYARRTYLRVGRVTARAGVPFRVTETNSIACGGARGVSDTFGAALWLSDWLFTLAATGAEGADIHTSGAFYKPFGFVYQNGVWRGAAAPIYYTLLAFWKAAPAGSRLLYAPTLGQRVRGRANVRLWATLDRHRTVRVLVINKSLHRGGAAVIRVRGARRPGSLMRLRASGPSARTATFAGQHIGLLATDGRLHGRKVARRVRGRRGVYRFRLPRASAALLTVPRARLRAR